MRLRVAFITMFCFLQLASLRGHAEFIQYSFFSTIVNNTDGSADDFHLEMSIVGSPSELLIVRPGDGDILNFGNIGQVFASQFWTTEPNPPQNGNTMVTANVDWSNPAVSVAQGDSVTFAVAFKAVGATVTVSDAFWTSSLLVSTANPDGKLGATLTGRSQPDVSELHVRSIGEPTTLTMIVLGLLSLRFGTRGRRGALRLDGTRIG